MAKEIHVSLPTENISCCNNIGNIHACQIWALNEVCQKCHPTQVVVPTIMVMRINLMNQPTERFVTHF